MARTHTRIPLALALVAGLSMGLAACGNEAPAPDGANAADGADATAATTQEVTYGEDGFVAVGSPAPDFALPGATRYGILADPVRLSDYRGKTVVLAFFFRARGRG